MHPKRLRPSQAFLGAQGATRLVPRSLLYGRGRQRFTAVCTSQKASEGSTTALRPDLGTLVLQQFAAGATLGPLLDGIHGTVHLLNYKVAPVDFGGLHSSLSVPILLGAFYAVVGPLHTALDALAVGSESGGAEAGPLGPLVSFLRTPANAAATEAAQSRISVPYIALNTGCVAAALFLSAVLYGADTAYAGIFLTLLACGVANFFVFDGTRQGLLLALLCAIAAPASELILINVLGLWQYPRPDIFGPGGVPSWVACCYFFYTTGVGNLARFFAAQSDSKTD